VDVTVVDRCTGCKETDVDLSLKMFETLADEAQGRVVSGLLFARKPEVILNSCRLEVGHG